MGGLIAALILFLTVSTSVVLGITLAYGAISAILFAFSRQTMPRLRSAQVLVANQSPAGGD